jgi:MoaA/NifB/PqqE/SkfB family radical SAM enzyme
MIVQMAKRTLSNTDLRLLWKFSVNFGLKGMISVQRFKRRIKRGIWFPPFLYISITNACNLRCTGCWADVFAPARHLDLDDLNRLIASARQHGNSFFGILGGEPFMHPQLFDLLAAHPGCYFQVFTNAQFITDEVAARLRALGNVTPLISIEGNEIVSDERRGRAKVYSHTMRGLETCVQHRLITGVATSLCQSNIADLLTESWLDELIRRGVTYVWFYTYRPVGPQPAPELALTPEQVLQVRRFCVEMRKRKPIGIVDAYWDDQGHALCPAVTGISHHIGPGGDIEPCPIIQFAGAKITDNAGDIFKTMTEAAYLADFRKTVADATRGCVVLERPDLLRAFVAKHNLRDTTARQTALAELSAMKPRTSQHNPSNEIPEEHWAYRFAKKHWFFGFGAYS